MKKRISKILVMIIMFSLITSLIPMNQTNVSCAATYLGKFNAEEFETITTINKDLEGNISLEQAMKIAKSVYSDLYYFHDSNFERSNGERYYVINIKDKVENHYTSLTQLFISFDGEICVEGYTSDQKIYVYNGDNILIKTKTLQAYSKILLQEYNLNEEEDDLKTHFSICDFNADGIQDLILSKEEHILSEKQYYTFENGKVIEIEGPSGNEAYPVYGDLYSLPSRGTYAFYRGGPASDDNNGNGYMPHTIMEYKLENQKIKLINDLYWVEYQFGDKAGLNEYYLNGTQCTAEDYQNIYNSFSDRIEFYANSEKNRMYWGVNDSGDMENDEKTTITTIRKTPTKQYDSYNVVKYEDTDSGKIIKTAVSYNKAIEDYLSKINKQASNDIKGNNKQKKSVGKQLMEKDKDVHTLTYVASDEYAIAAYEMLAEYYDECTKTGIDIGKIKITDDYITISSNIVKKITNSIDCFERTSRINGHTVHANILGVGGAITGSINVDGVSFLVNSPYNEVSKVMTDYINNLSENVKDVLKQSLFSVLTELAHYTYIDQLAEDELKKLFNGKIDSLQKMGYGDLFKVLKGAKKTYNITKKITSVKSTADLKEALTIDNLKEIYKELSDTDFSDNTIKNETVNSAYNNVIESKKALEDDLFNYIYGYKKEDEGVWQWIKRKININCPVDFTIYDTDDNIVASIIDGVANSNDSNIVLELNGDEKVIYILDERYINLQMTATDNGTMDVTIEDMNDGKPMSRLNYYDIKLTDEEKYAQELNTDNINGQLNQFPIVSDNDVQINANDYFQATDDACVNVKCTSSEGGYVENDLSEIFVKGDPVELYAISYDDFVFEGWYIDDKLVEISPLYRFTAKSDVSIHASFKKKEINYLTSLYDIEYGENYDDFAWINIYDKNNSAYDVELKMYGIDETDNDISALNIMYKKGDITLSQKETIVLDENAEVYLYGILKKGYESIIITDAEENLVATLLSNGELPDIEILPTSSPSASPTAKPTISPTKKPNQPTALPSESPTVFSSIAFGTKTTVGKMKYKVTKVNNNGAGEVTLIGTTRKKSDKRFTTLNVGNTVKIKGKSFKITAIGNNAFRGYKKLKSVTIGKNVKKIGTKAFYGCKKLKKIIIKTKQLQTKTLGNKAFKGIYSRVNIKVPKPKLKSYKKILREKGVGKRAKIHT